jgi:hypothetical protein
VWRKVVKNVMRYAGRKVKRGGDVETEERGGVETEDR